jgi:hypothetical protein
VFTRHIGEPHERDRENVVEAGNKSSTCDAGGMSVRSSESGALRVRKMVQTRRATFRSLKTQVKNRIDLESSSHYTKRRKL